MKLLNTAYSEPSQKSRMKSGQKLIQVSGNYIEFPKERVKTSVGIEIFKTKNQCKTTQVLDATDDTRHTGKRGLSTLEKT